MVFNFDFGRRTLIIAPRHAVGRVRMAEPEGFEPSIGLYNPITV
jgi:hypothetical protein